MKAPSELLLENFSIYFFTCGLREWILQTLSHQNFVEQFEHESLLWVYNVNNRVLITTNK